MASQIPKSGKIIPLNIVMTYPVCWNRYSILRDFVQNFYDSVGANQWNSKFKYHYDIKKRQLTMYIDDVEFSYEWLLHIGASTKTSNSAQYAGYFGEGFKIASLCALRDCSWNVEMHSGDWKLKVITQEQTIDHQIVKMLAYHVHKTQNNRGSKLILSSINPCDYETFQTVLESFYYPENPMFGDKIWESKYGAVYKRSKKPIHKGLPYVSDYGRKGAVFCAYQMLGTNPFDLIVCLHHYKKEDRERKGLYSFDVVSIFHKLSYYLDPAASLFVLIKMRRYWNSYKPTPYCIHSWSPTVDSLIYNISQSMVHTNMFRTMYPNLLCLKRIKSIQEKNKRSQAKSWIESQDEKYLMVKDTFQKLSYPTLEEFCEEHGGFVIDDSVTHPVENQCFEILEKLTQNIYCGFFIFKDWPERKLITNEKAIYHGMALVFKRHRTLINKCSLSIRYDIGMIYLKKSIFRKTAFYDALATYIHELCHTFGGDSSHAFSLGLTHAMEILLNHQAEIENSKKEWENVFEVQNAHGD